MVINKKKRSKKVRHQSPVSFNPSMSIVHTIHAYLRGKQHSPRMKRVALIADDPGCNWMIYTGFQLFFFSMDHF